MDPTTPLQPTAPPQTRHKLIREIIVALLLFAIPTALFLYINKPYKAPINTPIIPRIAMTPTPTPDPTANWKTYTADSKYGFTFKYPDSWSEDCNNDPVYIYLSEKICPKPFPTFPYGGVASYIKVVVWPKPAGRTAEDVKKSREKDNPPTKEVTTPKIANYDVAASYFGGAGVPNTTVYIVNNPSDPTYIEITGDGIDEKTYNQILSTFKFLDVLLTPTAKITISPTGNKNQVMCTQEVKLCPNGSSVGRTGPNCEFAACPK